MSMDGRNHMGDDPFAGQRRAWAQELEKAHHEINRLTLELAALKEELSRYREYCKLTVPYGAGGPP
jgi:hypothetical protein